VSHRINVNLWVIKDEHEFYEKCDFAYPVMKYVEENHAEDFSRWYFDMCYANWKENKHTVILKSYRTEEYKNHVLSIEVTGDDSNWLYRVIKKAAPKVD